MLTPALATFIERMPKIELHLHLEGAVAPRTFLELSQRNGIPLPVRTEQELAALFHYEDFHAFLGAFMALAATIVHGEDFELLAFDLGMELAAQHVVYAEVMLSPMQHVRRGVDLREALAGTAAGFARAAQHGGPRVGLVLDYGRQYGAAAAWPILETAIACRSIGVVGWSIGGNEIGHPPEEFIELFAAARAAGLGVMAHAGEVVGPASVWGAIDVLEVSRIGHGIRSVDDPALLAALAARGIVLDVCPSSNIRTKAITAWPAHPLRQLYDAGVPVTINSDDPTFFETTITEEFRRAAHYLGFTAADFCAMTRTAAQATFLPPAERAALLATIEPSLHQLRAELGV
ncbi:adenosine deaminase [Chloroflexus islandicus]|uniref:Adenosine deaminase n=1 Tax=Chloroflexus islandicus TaxID=1707952 RepID=A0A178M8F2_9CHLR|nr:adenosine deaminase [Chloroflexus islandicus]OAN45039.1 adenosine deaminase [Chloroflexus islandicus]